MRRRREGGDGGKAEILIECHGRFDVPTALRICHALEEFDPYWVEEPVIPDTMRALADVRSRVRVPIACGERLYTTQQILDAIELNCCDYLQPDASHAGGITAMKGIAAICDAHHVPFCAHNPSGPVANAVTLALGVSTPGYCIHETLFDDVPWRREVIDEDVKFVDGYMYVNDRPGLGIELDEKAAAAHPYEPHWLRHYVGTLTNVRPPDSCAYYHARCAILPVYGQSGEMADTGDLKSLARFRAYGFDSRLWHQMKASSKRFYAKETGHGGSGR